MTYLYLFWSFLKIGMFGFGGGYAMLSLIQHEVVDKYGWLTPKQFTVLVAVSQMTPGPIGINSATYVGYSVTGNVWGAALATFAVCLPSFAMILAISYFFVMLKRNKFFYGMLAGMRPLSVGLMAAAALVLANGENFIDWKSVAIFWVGRNCAVLGRLCSETAAFAVPLLKTGLRFLYLTRIILTFFANQTNRG